MPFIPPKLLPYVQTVVAVLVVTGMSAAMYVASSEAPIQDRYQSDVTEHLLNNLVATAIQPTDQAPVNLDAATLLQHLQYSDCWPAWEQAYFKPSRKQQLLDLLPKSASADSPLHCDQHCVFDRLSRRLNQINQQLFLASDILVRQHKLTQHYTIPASAWATNSCLVLQQHVDVGQSLLTTAKNPAPLVRVPISIEHIQLAMQQFSRAAVELTQTGNIYWCERHRVLKNDGNQAVLCQNTQRHVQFKPWVLSGKNPWLGLDGCLYVNQGSQLFYVTSGRTNSLTNHIGLICQTAAGQDHHARPLVINHHQQGHHSLLLPPDFATITHSLQQIRHPNPIYSPDVPMEEDAPNLIENNLVSIDQTERPIGLHVHTTLQLEPQKNAQLIALCYTGHLEACDEVGVFRQSPQALADFKHFYESAPVRKVGIVLLDVATGEIEALASSHSSCFVSDHTLAATQADCPKTNYPLVSSVDALRNHAFFDDAQPASTVKPIMALSFLQQGQSDPQLGKEIASSDSPAFARRMFCEYSPYKTPAEACQLPKMVVDQAISMGWNPQCQPEMATFGLSTCGKYNPMLGQFNPLNLGQRNADLAWQSRQLYGRFGVEPAFDRDGQMLGFQAIQRYQFSVNPAETNLDSRLSYRYKTPLANNVALGQENSRVTPLGVAGLYAHLAAAANGQTEQIIPHFLRRTYAVNTELAPIMAQLRADRLPVQTSSAHAAQLLSMMQGALKPSLRGTAAQACQHVWGKQICESQQRIAGKTGTPTQKNARPYRWFASTYQSHPHAQGFDKVMVVLVEQNWKKGSAVNSVAAQGAKNYAPEIAFQLMQANHINLGAAQ